MQTKTIKKSEVALLRGLKFKNADIAKKFNITLEETITMLKHFGLYNSKTVTTTKDYTLNFVDDTTATGNIAVQYAEPVEQLN